MTYIFVIFVGTKIKSFECLQGKGFPAEVRGWREVTNSSSCDVAILPLDTKDLPFSPRFSPYDFYRDASSAILQLVNQWLNFT